MIHLSSTRKLSEKMDPIGASAECDRSVVSPTPIVQKIKFEAEIEEPRLVVQAKRVRGLVNFNY